MSYYTDTSVQNKEGNKKWKQFFKSYWKWMVIREMVVAGFLVLAFPDIVNAAAPEDALAGLVDTFTAMVNALTVTLDKMLEAFELYLGAL